MKRLVSLLVAAFTLFSSVQMASAMTDTQILADPVQNEYIGRTVAAEVIASLNFNDVAPGFWAQEAIVRGGALGKVRTAGQNFYPTALVSHADAIVETLQMMGMEHIALQNAIAIQGESFTVSTPAGTQHFFLMDNSPFPRDVLGFLYTAYSIGLINEYVFASALGADQVAYAANEAARAILAENPNADVDWVPETGFAPFNFPWSDNTSRQQIADWVVRGMRYVNSDAFPIGDPILHLNRFLDASQVDVNVRLSVEAALREGVMSGRGGNFFDPTGTITRAEVAQMMRNLDEIYYETHGITRHIGTVGAIVDGQFTTTHQGQLVRSFFIRRSDGRVDQLTYALTDGPGSSSLDAVVLRDGLVGGLISLTEGDQIEYLVHNEDGTVLYVHVLHSEPAVLSYVIGMLNRIDVDENTITLTDHTGKTFAYVMVDGLTGQDSDGAEFIYINHRRRLINQAPFGANVRLSMVNDIVESIEFLGQQAIVLEQRGIVVENNPYLGFLRFIDNNGNDVVRFYYEDHMRVTKRDFYHPSDEIGYIAQMFPHFRFNPLESAVAEIQPGDIIFIRFDPDDPNVITEISASTNYIVRHGRIVEFNFDPIYGDVVNMLLELGNGQTVWHTVPVNIFMFQEGRPISAMDVRVGDFARVLVNVAVLEPGHVMESVRELVLEGDMRHVVDILRGQLAGMHGLQNQLQLQNVQTLQGDRWVNHQNVGQFDIAGRDIEFFMDGNRISMEHAVRNLRRAQGQVYVAVENHFAGPRLRMVSFRSGGERMMSPEGVISAPGTGEFATTNSNGFIGTDAGTIVRRDGRLVSGRDIQRFDDVVVVLNGGIAAVVDIPSVGSLTDGMALRQIQRARIQSVDAGRSFRVHSLAVLDGVNWNFTPIEREYAIDFNTRFLREEGITSIDNFLGYTEDTAINRVFTVVTDGTRADWVVEAPYANHAIRGVIFDMTTENTSMGTVVTEVQMRDVTRYDRTTGRWIPISLTNATGTVTIPINSLVMLQEDIVSSNQLQIGNQVKVMTTALPDTLPIGFEINGYIIFVER